MQGKNCSQDNDVSVTLSAIQTSTGIGRLEHLLSGSLPGTITLCTAHVWTYAHMQCTSEAGHPESFRLASIKGDLRMHLSSFMCSSERCSGETSICSYLPCSGACTLGLTLPTSYIPSFQLQSMCTGLGVHRLLCSKVELPDPSWNRVNWAQHTCLDFHACSLGSRSTKATRGLSNFSGMSPCVAHTHCTTLVKPLPTLYPVHVLGPILCYRKEGKATSLPRNKVIAATMGLRLKWEDRSSHSGFWI